jgi:hypothetical protein
VVPVPIVEKPKRKYTKKAVDTLAEPIVAVVEEKPKRKYTKKAKPVDV